MEFQGRWRGFIVWTILMTGSAAMAAQARDSDDQPTLIVRVDNVAPVPADDLLFAEGRAAAVFGRIGARIRWTNQDQAVREHIEAPFTIVLVSAENEGGRASTFVDALGQANPSVGRAHVFCDRVAALHVGTPRTISILLGDVIAHELGHLLLPPPGHSADGIMRPQLETRLWGVKTFTTPQARMILSQIRRLRD